MHDSFSMTQANYLQEVEITEMLSVKILGSEGFYLLTLWPKNNKKNDYCCAKTYVLCTRSTVICALDH